MATQLRSWLRLGPQAEVDQETARGCFILNVLEAPPATHCDAWIPILRTSPQNEVSAAVAALDAVAARVEHERSVGRTVYLHCGQGIERSPLVAAWVLWKLGETPTFDRAYDEVARLHAPTQRRDGCFPGRRVADRESKALE